MTWLNVHREITGEKDKVHQTWRLYLRLLRKGYIGIYRLRKWYISILISRMLRKEFNKLLDQGYPFLKYPPA